MAHFQIHVFLGKNFNFASLVKHNCYCSSPVYFSVSVTHSWRFQSIQEKLGCSINKSEISHHAYKVATCFTNSLFSCFSMMWTQFDFQSVHGSEAKILVFPLGFVKNSPLLNHWGELIQGDGKKGRETSPTGLPPPLHFFFSQCH